MCADIKTRVAGLAIGVLLAIPLGALYLQAYRLAFVQGQLGVCEVAAGWRKAVAP